MCWFTALIMSCPVCKTLSAVSYMNYGPFTSYAPTYDSSFANISKEDSDLIYSLYGEESSLQGSDRYVQCDHRRTQGQWHLQKTSLEAFLADYFPDVSLFCQVYSVWRRSVVSCRLGFNWALSLIFISKLPFSKVCFDSIMTCTWILWHFLFHNVHDSGVVTAISLFSQSHAPCHSCASKLKTATWFS